MRSLTASLRHKVYLQRKVQVADNGGGYTTEWENVATLWAAIDRVRGSEKYISGQVGVHSTHRFKLRYNHEITPDMRLLFGERLFNIRFIASPDEKNTVLEIYAEEGVSA